MRTVPVFSVVLCAFAGCPTDEATPTGCEIDAVLVDSPDFFPEGVDLAPDGTLFVGSLAGQGIWTAPSCEAEAVPFAALQGPAPSAVGLLVDAERGWLWAATGDFGTGADPAIEAFDLRTGAPVARHPLQGGSGFPNDLALGVDGSLFVTETFASGVYRIAASDAGSDTEAALWIAPPEAAVAPGALGFNGVVVDGDTLIVAHTEQGVLYGIPIEADGSPGAASVLPLDRPLAAPDGLELLPDGRIAVVEGGVASVVAVDPSTGVVESVADGFDFPTTVAASGSELWVVESQLDHLLGIDPAPAVAPFEVIRREL